MAPYNTSLKACLYIHALPVYCYHLEFPFRIGWEIKLTQLQQHAPLHQQPGLSFTVCIAYSTELTWNPCNITYIYITQCHITLSALVIDTLHLV